MRIPSRLLGLAVFSLAPALSARAEYRPVAVLVPDSGVGMVSEYASLLPKWGEHNATVLVPTSATNETNLVWTFWGHTRVDPSEWPQGPGARVSLTIVAESTINVRVSSFVRAGNWSAPAHGGSVVLPAGKPVTVQVPLPAAPSEPVEVLRILFEANDTVPAFAVTNWSVGSDSEPASASR